MTTRIKTDNIEDGAVTAAKFGIEYLAIDDIASQFDYLTRTFILRHYGTPIDILSAYNLEISLGGVKLYPASKWEDYLHQPIITEFDKGFQISGSTVTFAAPPIPGMSFQGTFNSKTSVQLRNKQVPFSARAIMLSY
jgi:hypothetical protein